MKSNPGGQIPVDEILGRDELIARLWEILDRQSVIMTAERRIGKTSVIRKMCANPPGSWIPVLQDLEQVHSANEFAVLVYEAIRGFLGTRKKVEYAAHQFLHQIGGTEVAGVIRLPDGKERHWKTLLTRAVDDLLAHQKPKRLIFFWDEMPYMLDTIQSREGEETAMEVLDVLRALRQRSSDFRMVLTGSIGLHHILGSLKAADYKNEPVNDMLEVEVPPFSLTDAEDLARRLIQGEVLKSSDTGQSARTIAEQGDCFPFYIHSIVKALKLSGRTADPASVIDTVNDQLVSPNDPWRLVHYRERIPSYYPQHERLVTTILDHLAVNDRPVSVNEILSAVKASMEFDDRDRLLSLLKLLQRDHYLARLHSGEVHFRFPLIRRWWKLDRGL